MTLKLVLTAEPFAVMLKGEKKLEFREKSSWMESRLKDSATGEDRQYNSVEFVNGHGATKPRFTVSYKGYKLVQEGVHHSYSNGLEVDTRGRPTYVIFLGDDVCETTLAEASG